MDCNCNQRSAGSCRPQMPPPCMNTGCGCGAAMPMPPIQPRMGNQGVMPGRDMRPDVFQPMQCTMESANMPIAMAYVPWQQWRQTYSMDKALSRGTIFPELDLPFVMGRCR